MHAGSRSHAYRGEASRTRRRLDVTVRSCLPMCARAGVRAESKCNQSVAGVDVGGAAWSFFSFNVDTQSVVVSRLSLVAAPLVGAQRGAVVGRLVAAPEPGGCAPGAVPVWCC